MALDGAAAGDGGFQGLVEGHVDGEAVLDAIRLDLEERLEDLVRADRDGVDLIRREPGRAVSTAFRCLGTYDVADG